MTHNNIELSHRAERDDYKQSGSDRQTIATAPEPAAPVRRFSRLFVLNVVKLLHRAAHLFVRCAHIVRFLLLFRRQNRPDLSHRVIDDSFGLLHRFLVDLDQLRFSLIEDRLNLGLLVRRQVQRFGHVLERVSPVPATMAAMRNRKASRSDRTCY
jgi:hypothetical protein